MEKLTIEHLAPYLPYELLFDISHTEYGKIESKRLKYCKLTGLHINGICTFETSIKSQNNGLLYFNIDVAKPILRPLSDLTKEIEHNGEKFVPIDELYEWCECDFEANYIDALKENFALITVCPYSLFEKCLEWHFDVFGLIDKGLAKNKNEL